MTHPLDLDIVEKLRLEEEFFAQPFLMSYSGLNKLVYSPGAFYQHYILKQKDDVTDKAAAEGKLLHCKILTPNRFDEEFLVLPDSFPSENPKKVMDRLRVHLNEAYPEIIDETGVIENLENIRLALLDILKDENLYQTLKTDDQRIDKIMTSKNMEYLHFLIKSKYKTMVDKSMVTFADRVRDAFVSNPTVASIMALNDFDRSRVKAYNELQLVHFPERYSFGLKGIIDNLVIDHDKEVIRINDIKKSSKALNNFKDSIEYYNYWIQAAIYTTLVRENSSTAFSVDYPIEFRFIVADPYMHIGVLKVSDKTMNEWLDKTHELLNVAKFHFDHKDFSLPHQFLMSETHEHVL